MLGLRVRVDDASEVLAFASRADFEAFIAFVEIYQKESGAGNGYYAYWIFDSESFPVDENSKTELDWERVRRMANSIADARTGTPAFTVNLGQDIGGGIRFDFTFPDRRPAEIGEMFRIFARSEVGRDVPTEGRVLRQENDNLVVISSSHEGDDGQPKDTAEEFSVSPDHIMWIPDWLKRQRDARAARAEART